MGKQEEEQKKKEEAEKPHMLGEDESTWTPDYEEEPACEKNMGTWVAAVYCEEQMSRLNVDEFGQSTAGDQKPVTPVDLMPLDGAWNQEAEDEDEKPWTPDYIMEQEEQKEPATNTLVMKDIARPTNQSSSHPAAGLIAGCVVGAAVAAAIVAYRSK